MSNRSRTESATQRRAFPRVSRSCPVSFRVLEKKPGGTGADASRAIMNNISGGGICFTSDSAMEEETMLAMQVDLPGYPAGVISMGRVVWSRPADDEPGRFEIGVEFWWVGWKDESAQRQISDYITSALEDEKRG